VIALNGRATTISNEPISVIRITIAGWTVTTGISIGVVIVITILIAIVVEATREVDLVTN
jgi:hypothetical protein